MSEPSDAAVEAAGREYNKIFTDEVFYDADGEECVGPALSYPEMRSVLAAAYAVDRVASGPPPAGNAPDATEFIQAARMVTMHPVRCGGAYCGDPDCDALTDLRAALAKYDAGSGSSAALREAPEPTEPEEPHQCKRCDRPLQRLIHGIPTEGP